MATSTMGTIFYKKTGIEGAEVYTQILGMLTKPQLPGLPQSIDSTSQEEKIATNVAGPKAAPDPTFQFKHMAHGASSTNFKLFQTDEGSATAIGYGVLYPDGGAVEWDAIPAVVRDGTGANALDTFSVYMQNMDNVTMVETGPTTFTSVA